jgi:hypothetical protein
MYKRRNEVERLLRRLKGYRRIFSRFAKLDLMSLSRSDRDLDGSQSLRGDESCQWVPLTNP